MARRESRLARRSTPRHPPLPADPGLDSGLHAPKEMHMGVELDHSFTMPHAADENFAAITDLERLIPCVEGGSVIETIDDDSVKAEIKVKMGAMSMTFIGTVTVTEKDPGAHTATM